MWIATICKLCQTDKSLEKGLAESLDQPKKLMEKVFTSLSLKEKDFQTFVAASKESIDEYNNIIVEKFDENILSLSLRSDFTKSRYPKFHKFYTTHCVSRTYHFHIFKCSDPDCPWHEPLRFGEPVPTDSDDGSIKYIEGSDESEKFLPSKLEDPSKRNHGMNENIIVKIKQNFKAKIGLKLTFGKSAMKNVNFDKNLLFQIISSGFNKWF